MVEQLPYIDEVLVLFYFVVVLPFFEPKTLQITKKILRC